jgi:hypothetical protein
MSSTGENENDLRKILDLTRFASVLLLALHVYYVCYSAFVSWQLTSRFSDKLLSHIAATDLFKSFNWPKLFSLCLLCVGLIGVQGKKDVEQNWRPPYIFGIGSGHIFLAARFFFDGKLLTKQLQSVTFFFSAQDTCCF